MYLKLLKTLSMRSGAIRKQLSSVNMKSWYGRESSLQRDKLLKHTTDPPRYACELCDKSYGQKCHLLQHIEEEHSPNLNLKQEDAHEYAKSTDH